MLLVWAVAAASLLIGNPHAFDAMSMDDFMRLAEVRDFLGGQNWFDLTQYRLHPPAGVIMHWSRLVDLPIAALVSLFSLFTTMANAETLTAAAWPLLLLLPALALTSALARRLGGDGAMLPALLLAAVCAPTLVHFRPGALDHHDLQLVLLLAAIHGLTDDDAARTGPAWGGVAAALSLAVSLEMAPAIAALLAAAGLRWVIGGRKAAPLAACFGLSFSVASAACFAITVPYARWSAALCDQLALPAAVAAVMAGSLLALLCALPIHRAYSRLIAGAMTGALVVAVMARFFPACLGDPYAQLDARLASIWLGHVAEAQNFREFAQNLPAEFPMIYAPPCAALLLAACTLIGARPDERRRWIAPILTLGILLGVTLWQVRGAAGANLAAIPLIAAAVTRLFGAKPLLANPRALIVLLALSTPVLLLAGKAATQWRNAPGQFYAAGPLACTGIASVAPLARLAPGLVVSHVDLGSTILAGTRHGVLAAPYHRNIEGNRIALDILLGDDATASRLLQAEHVSYVAICPGAPERFNLRRIAPEGLAERLARGEVPPYLAPVPTGPETPLRVFRVR